MNWLHLPTSNSSKVLLAICAVLMLLSSGLQWTIPDDAGIGAAFLMREYAGRIAAAGLAMLVAALVVALLTGQSKRLGAFMAKAFGLWIVLPVLTGPWLALGVSGVFMSFYDGPLFHAWNKARLGVTITLQDQEFSIEHCRVGAYTTTYQIEARHDQELNFGQAWPSDYSFFSYSDYPKRSLDEQLDYVGESYLPWASSFGIYRVAEGSHKLVVRGGGPFLLQVYSTEPLWTPELLLAGNESFALLYADTFSRAELEAMASPHLPNWCPPFSCPPDNAPLGGLLQRKGVIGEIVDLRLLDGKGHDDFVDASVSVQINRSGDYELTGELFDAEGQYLAESSFETRGQRPLCKGQHTLRLGFPFRNMLHNNGGIHGPFTLTNLKLFYYGPDASLGEEVDTSDN
jgi:hypothetical protein